MLCRPPGNRGTSALGLPKLTSAVGAIAATSAGGGGTATCAGAADRVAACLWATGLLLAALAAPSELDQACRLMYRLYGMYLAVLSARMEAVPMLTGAAGAIAATSAGGGGTATCAGATDRVAACLWATGLLPAALAAQSELDQACQLMYRLYGMYLAVLSACMEAEVATHEDAGAGSSVFTATRGHPPDARRGNPWWQLGERPPPKAPQAPLLTPRVGTPGRR